MSAHWARSDAWVFAAIAGITEANGCNLADVVMRADAINHAIVTEVEFVQAIRRLLAADLVGADVTADRYWHTHKGDALYQKHMARRGLFGWIEALPPALERAGVPEAATWSLPAGYFKRAVNRYLRRARGMRK